MSWKNDGESDDVQFNCLTTESCSLFIFQSSAPEVCFSGVRTSARTSAESFKTR